MFNALNHTLFIQAFIFIPLLILLEDFSALKANERAAEIARASAAGNSSNYTVESLDVRQVGQGIS